MGKSQLHDQIAELNSQIGELKGQMKLVINKLNEMSTKYNGYSEKTISVEKELEEISKMLSNHLQEHKNEKGLKAHTRAAIYGGLAGSISAFALSLITRFFLM